MLYPCLLYRKTCLENFCSINKQKGNGVQSQVKLVKSVVSMLCVHKNVGCTIANVLILRSSPLWILSIDATFVARQVRVIVVSSGLCSCIIYICVYVC